MDVYRAAIKIIADVHVIADGMEAVVEQNSIMIIVTIIIVTTGLAKMVYTLTVVHAMEDILDFTVILRKSTNVQVIPVKIQEYVMTTLISTHVPVQQDLQELIVRQITFVVETPVTMEDVLKDCQVIVVCVMLDTPAYSVIQTSTNVLVIRVNTLEYAMIT